MLRRCITIMCQAETVLSASLSQQISEIQTKNIISDQKNVNRNLEIDNGNSITDAKLLHSHCTRVIQTLGPSTPPEAFVFRGNAYLALGRPYFALADYATASSVLQFSHEHHQAKCLRAVCHFPLTQSAIFPATDTHVHIHVEPWLVHGVKVETHIDSLASSENKSEQISTNANQTIAANDNNISKGADMGINCTNNKNDVDKTVGVVMEAMSRGVYYRPYSGHHHETHQCVNNTDDKLLPNNQNESLEKGSAITLPVTPWVRYPLRDNHCAYCASPLEDRVFPCNVDDHHMIAEEKMENNLHKSAKRKHGCHEEYCSRECRAMALSTYHAVVCRNELYQALELDLFDKAIKWQPPRQTDKLNNSGDGVAMESSNNNNNDKKHNKTNEYTKGVEGEDVFEFYQIRHNPYYYQLLLLRIMAMATQQHLTATTLAEIRLLTGRLTFRPAELCDGMLHFYLRLARALRIQTTSCYEEFISILSRIHANSLFTDTDIQLVLPWAMFNHSCSANAMIDWPSRQIIATRQINPNEEITINYAPETCDWQCERRQEFFNSYFDFQCKCTACQVEKQK